MKDTAAVCLRRLQEFFSAQAVLDWGIAAVGPTPNSERLRAWVSQGLHAAMGFMADRLEERTSPRAFHPWAESAVVFSIPYASPLGSSSGPYRVAAYALGEDYHHKARALLQAAEKFLREDPALSSLRFYGFADTAPVFERDLASEAGLGWRGKNGCTLNRKHGSAFNLAGFFIDLALPRSEPVEDFCGGCTRCIDLCPTQALEGPGRLNANKCISYWTIEDKGEIPEELGKDFGGWIFGCDVCQEVCPWNHKHLASRQADPGALENAARLPSKAEEWIGLLRKGGGFQSRFKGTPFTRAGRRSLLRNLAMAIGNLQDTEAAGALAGLLDRETDPRLTNQVRLTLSRLGPLNE